MEDLRTRAEEEVVGVAEYDLRLDIVLQLLALHAFDGTHRSDGHKDWREDIAVVGMYHARPRSNPLRLAM